MEHQEQLINRILKEIIKDNSSSEIVSFLLDMSEKQKKLIKKLLRDAIHYTIKELKYE